MIIWLNSKWPLGSSTGTRRSCLMINKIPLIFFLLIAYNIYSQFDAVRKIKIDKSLCKCDVSAVGWLHETNRCVCTVYWDSSSRHIPEVEFTVVSLPETSRFLSNAIHCPVFHASYLSTSYVFLVLEFSTSTADDGEGGFVYFFFKFWICLVFKTTLFRQERKLVAAKWARSWRFALKTAY